MLLQIPKEMKKELVEEFGDSEKAIKTLLSESSDENEKLKKIIKKYKEDKKIDWE